MLQLKESTVGAILGTPPHAKMAMFNLQRERWMLKAFVWSSMN